MFYVDRVISQLYRLNKQTILITYETTLQLCTLQRCNVRVVNKLQVQLKTSNSLPRKSKLVTNSRKSSNSMYNSIVTHG